MKCNELFRYGVNNQFADEEFFDEAFNATEEMLEDDESEIDNLEHIAEDEPNFVTLSRVQNKPILPPVIVMGGRLRETVENDEGFVEGTKTVFIQRFPRLLKN